MGKIFSSIKKHKQGLPNYEITVKTGDVKGDGTDAKVYIILIDENGNISRDIQLKCTCEQDAFKTGNTETFKVWNVPTVQGPIEKIELWKGPKHNDWYVEVIEVKLVGSEQCIPFPCNRWITEDKFVLIKYDAILPQFDVAREQQREHELAENRAIYEPIEISPGFPKQTKECPPAQKFSYHYEFNLGGRVVGDVVTDLSDFTLKKWKKLNDTLDVYKGSFPIPTGCYHWQYDEHFGRQRVSGVNPTAIRLCTKIPSKIPVTTEMVKHSLPEGLTLEEAATQKRIFIVDMEILHQLNVRMNGVLCAPIGLFYNTGDELMPIAIQLFQEPGNENPVFLPTDPKYLWMLVKMFFNNAAAQHHQSNAHLNFTHLVGGMFATSVHQFLSPSHPIFRLLAPHFLFLIAINSLAVTSLINPGGFIDKNMTMARDGLFELVKRGFKDYRLDVNGWLPEDLKNRGVEDTEVLQHYPYRDDGLLIHHAIHTYVSDIVNHFYDRKSKLAEDYELQSWAEALVEPRHFGLKGVAGDGEFENNEDLIKVLTSIIFLCSAEHAAVNFGQYNAYGYPANYPGILRGNPPRSKDVIQEKDILDQLPTRSQTILIMTVTSILSDMGTDKLGTFDVQYLYDPNSVKAAEKFRVTLLKISDKVKARNEKARAHPYPYLDPEHVPNAISI